MKTTSRLLSLSLSLALGAVASAAPPVTLLVDSFNAATGGTTDLNVDLARQTGAAAPLSYSMAGGRGITAISSRTATR